MAKKSASKSTKIVVKGSKVVKRDAKSGQFVSIKTNKNGPKKGGDGGDPKP